MHSKVKKNKFHGFSKQNKLFDLLPWFCSFIIKRRIKLVFNLLALQLFIKGLVKNVYYLKLFSFLVAESNFDDEESDGYCDENEPEHVDAVDEKTSPRKGDLQIIDLEDDEEEEASTTFIENVESDDDDDESSSYEKKFVRGVATPTGSVTHSSSSSVASPALTPSLGVAANTTTEEEDDEEEEEDDATNVTLSPNEVVVVANDTTFVTDDVPSSPSPPDMSHVSVVVVGGGDVCVIDSSLSSNGSSSHHRAGIVTPSRNDVGRSSSSASHSSSVGGGPIIPPPKSYSSSISDDDRNNDVSSPCSIVLEGTTVDDTEDSDVIRSTDRNDPSMPNGHVDSEEDSGVHVMAKSVDEFQELPHDEEIARESVVKTIKF